MDDINNSNFQTGGVVYGGSFDPLAVDCCGYGAATTNSSFSMSDLLAAIRVYENSVERSNYNISNQNVWTKPRLEEFVEAINKAYGMVTAPPDPFKKQIVENPEVENEFKSLIFEEGKNDDDVNQSI